MPRRWPRSRWSVKPRLRVNNPPATWPQGVARHVLDRVDSTNAEAFRLAPTLGGPAWNGVGLVWYDVILGDISPAATFVEFARSTVAAAAARFGNGSPEHLAVDDAWQTVGVITHE